MLNLICNGEDRYFVRSFPTPESWDSVSLLVSLYWKDLVSRSMFK